MISLELNIYISLHRCEFHLVWQVKVVRETMNQMVEVWKEIPDDSDEAAVSNLESHSSAKGLFIFFKMKKNKIFELMNMAIYFILFIYFVVIGEQYIYWPSWIIFILCIVLICQGLW